MSSIVILRGAGASTSLDDYMYEEEGEPFYQRHADSLREGNPGSSPSCRVMQKSPRQAKAEGKVLDPFCEVIQWLKESEAAFQDKEWATCPPSDGWEG